MEDIDLSDHKVTSEVHVFSESSSNSGESVVTSVFKFSLPLNFVGIAAPAGKEGDADDDGDLLVRRKNHVDDYCLEIKHHVNTSLDLVGLQVWRGALLLADFLLHLSAELKITQDKSILELGAGTGISSIVAGMVTKQVLSTDIAKGNILSLIRTNVEQNSKWIRGQIGVEELDFYKHDYPANLVTQVEQANIIIAADVVYHDDLTDAFLSTLKNLMSMGRQKIALIALEKRFVFTLAELEVAAPCYEYFYDNLFREFSPDYSIEQLNTQLIPQYFCYERCKELVLFRITTKKQ
nr:EOG090X0C5G [Ilyocryptus agilis]